MSSSPTGVSAPAPVLAALVLAVLVPAALVPAGAHAVSRAAAAAASGRYSPPVPGAVARPFDEPRSRYGAGHRGVDFAAPPGAPVLAAGDGTVVFAGPVAGTSHVVVAHGGDLRTSYSYLSRVVVRRGARVARGDVVGAAGGTGAGHHAGILHLGLRVGDDYVDPMVLFATPDLAEVVHLAPLRESGRRTDRSWASEAFGVARGLDEVGRRVPSWVPASAAGGSDRGPFAGAVDVVSGWFGAAREVATRVPGAGAAASVAERLAAGVRARAECSDAAPPADGTGGSGHRLLAVGGVNSATDPRSGASFALPAERLGYLPDEIEWFSYAPDGRAYRPDDTHGAVAVAARRLGEQLRAAERREPGREVDLLAHSQGGVVVDAFLRHVYDPADPTFPPVGTVVTLSAPHRGAPLAGASRRIGATRSGRRVLAGTGSAFPPPDAPAVRDLTEGSRFLRRLWDARLPEHVELTTIGAVDDLVVPADRTAAAGATSVLVDPAGWADHRAIVDDPAALRAVRSALEGRSPPCRSVAGLVRDAVQPVVISRLEQTAGDVGATVGALADGLGFGR
jgi:murein DD-endopeptidase MepM/ murein hydrolase activator NlpD